MEEGFGVGVGVLLEVALGVNNPVIHCHIDLNRFTARLGAVNMLFSIVVLDL